MHHDIGLEETSARWQKSLEVSVCCVLSRTHCRVHEKVAARQTESGMDQTKQTHLLQASWLATRYKESIQGDGGLAGS